MHSTSENSDVSTHEMKYILYLPKKSIFFIVYLFGDLRSIELQCLEPKDKGLVVTQYQDQ